MSKKGPGMWSFIFGMAAGASAIFLSKKENRQKAQRVAKKIATKAVKAKTEYDQNPTAFKKKVVAKAKVTANKVVKQVKKKAAAEMIAAVKSKAKRPVSKKK